MEIIKEFKRKGRKYYVVNTEFGKCSIYSVDYNKGVKPRIKSALDTREYFKLKSESIHGKVYDYSLVDYKGSEHKVDIICPIHGVFKQTPHNHFKGNSCTECGKLSSSKSRITHTKGLENAIVYCLEIVDTDGSKFYKIGFTKHSLNYRYHSFSKSKMPYTYKVLWEKVLKVGLAKNLENSYHKLLAKYRYKPNISFAGCKTECFKMI